MHTAIDPKKDAWTIEPRTGGVRARVREVWTYRRLLRFFATRAIQRRYQNTILGRAWIFIRPLFPLIVKTMVFGGLLGVGSDGVPYFLFLVVGTSVWELFAGSLMWATRSLDMNRSLVGKVYVPRIILPISMMSPGFVVFAIHLAVVAVTLTYYYVSSGTLYLNLSSNLLLAPVAVVLAVVFALAIGLFTSVLGTHARDVRFTLAYVLDFWAFLTPVMYPLSAVPVKWHNWVLINPMATFVEMFKFAVLGIGGVTRQGLVISISVTVVVLAAGLIFFARAESDAIDRV